MRSWPAVVETVGAVAARARYAIWSPKS